MPRWVSSPTNGGSRDRNSNSEGGNANNACVLESDYEIDSPRSPKPFHERDGMLKKPIQAVREARCCGLVTKRWRYVYRQQIAVVRHTDRLDEDQSAWMEHPSFTQWRYNCPITKAGVLRARKIGEEIKSHSESGDNSFSVIVTSPYLRCVETAVEIAKVMELPVVVDRRLGEVDNAIGC